MAPVAVSDALLAAAPHVGAYVAELFGITAEADAFAKDVRERDPIWRFKREFAKKRVLKADAGKAWVASGGTAASAADVARAAFTAVLPSFARDALADEELAVARATMLVFEVDEIARKAAKAGGAEWTPELRVRAAHIRAAVAGVEQGPGVTRATATAGADATDQENASLVALVLDATEAWLAQRSHDHGDPAHRWASFHLPRRSTTTTSSKIPARPRAHPELFVGPEHERRERGSFVLTDRRGSAREVEEQIDYCILCHERDKDSYSKG